MCSNFPHNGTLICSTPNSCNTRTFYHHTHTRPLGLIDADTLASFKLELEIARILGLKIGATGLTLEELFQDHAVYFGFCSLSEHRLREEESAFVTDSRRIPAFKNAVSGSPRTSFGALLKLKYSFSPTSLLFQQGSLKPSCKPSSTT